MIKDEETKLVNVGSRGNHRQFHWTNYELEGDPGEHESEQRCRSNPRAARQAWNW